MTRLYRIPILLTMNVFIFHGTMSNPNSNWFPWLERELKVLGVEVFVPKFPTPEGQSLESWLKAFKPYQDKVDSETIFVGHSMGPGFFLRLLEQRTSPIKAAILVAPFYTYLDLPEPFPKLIETFIDHPFDWEKIKQNCPKFTVFCGTGDPYVPIEQSKFIAKKLGVELKIIKEGKHLNSEAGYLQFPEVLTAISVSGEVPKK